MPIVTPAVLTIRLSALGTELSISTAKEELFSKSIPLADDRWQNFFKGSIDELSVFPYALHPEAVKALATPPTGVGK